MVEVERRVQLVECEVRDEERWASTVVRWTNWAREREYCEVVSEIEREYNGESVW
jgi:hypothetical protein